MDDNPFVRECKIKASILLKTIRSTQSKADTSLHVAAARFRILPALNACTTDDILGRCDELQRKHALAVIAREAGYDDWAELRERSTRHQPNDPLVSNGIPKDLFYPDGAGGMMCAWFRNYDSAREAHRRSGGYLLPYGTQHFICGREHIISIGLNPDDPDWKEIEYDWSGSLRRDVCERLIRPLLKSR